MSRKRDKFTEDHKLYYPLIFSTIYTKVGNVDDAKDICQEIFFRFFEGYDKIKNSRKWLYGALKLVVFEFYRKKKGDVNIDEVFNDVGLTFVNGLKDTRIIISDAIEDMDNFGNDEDKTLFDLIAVHNYSYSKAGEQLGLTKRQVDYKYNRIVDRIMDYLNKKGIRAIEDLL